MEKPENDILLSFVLPVYNVEAYLEECVDSILQQVTSECEIILVNDGSTDSSGKLCRQYTEKNELIRVVEKENGGLSSARNAGLSIAEGKYITFVDSDDKVFPDSIAEILRWIKSEEADICFLRTVKFYADGTQKDLGEGIVRSQLYTQSREKAVRHLTTRPKYPGSSWAKLYRREFLLDNDLHFPFDRRYSEDLGFMRDCILCAQSFDALEVPYYQYRQGRKGSITNQITSRNFYDLLLFITESAQKLTVDGKCPDSISRDLMGFVAYEYLILLYLYASVPKNEQKDALTILNEYKWTLKFAVNRKGKLVFLISSLFGLKTASTLLRQYRKAVER